MHHSAWANSADGRQDFTKNASGGSYSYIGFCSNQTESDAALTYTDYRWSYVRGASGQNGTNGTNGTDGKGISNITEYYKISTSNTGITNTDSGWSTNVPTLTEIYKYLWNYELITYTDNSTSKTPAVMIGVYGDKGNKGDQGNTGDTGPQGPKGDKGDKGDQGNDGTSVTISSTSVTYAVTTTSTQPADSAFTYSSIPTVSQGNYLWSKTIVTYSDGTSTKTYTVSYQGNDGIDGTNGRDGTNGTNGTDGNDAEFYHLSPVVEKVIVDKNGTLGVQLQYQIAHIKGGSITTVSANSSGYWIRFKRNDNSTYYNLSTGTETPSYTNNSFITNYHQQSSKPIYLTVYLVYGSNATVKEQKTIAIIFDAGATLEITDNITSTVQGHTTSIGNLQNQVDNMEIGGYNLLRYTATPKYRNINDAYNSASDGTWCKASDGNSTSNPREVVTLSDAPVKGIEKGIRITLGQSGVPHIRYNEVPVLPNEYYTLSCYARLISGSAKLNIQQGNGTTSTNNYTSVTHDLTTSWRQYSYTFKITGSATNAYVGPITSLGTIEVCGMMVEKGNVATCWKPNPNDYEAQLTTISNSVSQIIQRADSIESTVNTHTTQINTANGNILSLQTDVSNVTQTANAITSTVSAQTDKVNLLMDGDTKNIFYPSCYNSDGMSPENNQWLFANTLNNAVTCSNWKCDNIVNYGKPIINGRTDIYANSPGTVYLYSPYVNLNTGNYYSLTYNFTQEYYTSSKIELCRYSNYSNALNYPTTAIYSTQTVKSFSSYEDAGTYNQDIFTFKPTYTGYYRIRLSITLGQSDYNNGDVANLDLSQISLYSSTSSTGISTGGFRPWVNTFSKLTSTISQTADRISLGLNRAGIDITTGKITSVADKFEWQNNDGETVLGLDANGDAVFKGTIKSPNFYHSICNFMEGGTYKDENNDTWAYCYDNSISDGIAGYGFQNEKYYSLTQLVNMTDGDYASFPSGFSICTGKADIVNMMPKTTNWSSTTAVKLPSPQHFIGKVIEVFAFSYGTTAKNVYVGSVINNRFANGVYWGGSRFYIQDSALDQVTLTTGTRTLFYSVNVNGTAYWVKLHSS